MDCRTLPWKLWLCALLLVACDFSIDDIELDRQLPVRSDSGVTDSAVLPDVGAADRTTGDAGATATAPMPSSAGFDASAADVSSVPEDAGNHDNHAPTAFQVDGAAAMPGFDANIAPIQARDAQVDAVPQALDDATDADIDDDDGGAPVPSLCRGDVACALVDLHISADFAPPGTHGAIAVSDGEQSVETLVVDDAGPQVWLPIGRSLIARTTVHGFWTDVVFFMLAPVHEAQPSVTTYVFSTSAIEAFTKPVGQALDDTKGFVAIDFYANHPGAGMALGGASDPAVVQSPLMLTLSNTLVAGGGNLMLFGNVQPGKLSPVAISPSDLHCDLVVSDLEYVAAPMTVLRFFARCTPVEP